MTNFFAIAATTIEGAVGRRGVTPFRAKLDMARFKQRTLGKSLIMGRRTAESMKWKPLPERVSIVVTTMGMEKVEKLIAPENMPRFRIVRSVEEAIQAARALETDAAFIGGHDIWLGGLPHCERLFLTVAHVPAVLDADAFIPHIGPCRLIDHSNVPAMADEPEQTFLELIPPVGGRFMPRAVTHEAPPRGTISHLNRLSYEWETRGK